MTEEEWLECAAPGPMLEFLRDKASDRKLRLFAAACCRRVPDSVFYSGFLDAIETAEQYADGLRDDAALAAVYNAARDLAAVHTPLPAWDGTGSMEYADWVGSNAAAFTCTPEINTIVAGDAAFWAPDALGGPGVESPEEKRGAQSHLIRDIFGNPFRPVTFDPDWRTTTALALARGIYDERAFDRMPILADALQDAGCDNDDILAHLRDANATHVRGCWALDLVLGKE